MNLQHVWRNAWVRFASKMLFPLSWNLVSGTTNIAHFSPRFSADGTNIYFARIETSSSGSGSLPPVSQRWDIYSADLHGENVEALTHQHFQAFSTLSFSSDGKKMLYSTESENGGLLHIYLLDKPSEPGKTFQPWAETAG